MKRYGDNVTPEDFLPEGSGEKKQNNVLVMFGGCGYGAGTFNKPPVRKAPRRDLRSLLGLRRKKSKEKE